MINKLQNFRNLFFTTCLITLTASTAWAGSVDLDTYYPSPFGNYDRLKLAPRTDPGPPCDPGTMYVDDTSTALQFCAATGTWAPGTWTQNTSNLYPTDSTVNVGIGITSPATLLDVAKDVAPSSGVTSMLSLRAYAMGEPPYNSMNSDGVALNFKSRSDGNVVDIGRISGILTQAGNPTFSAMAFSSYADVGGTNALTETVRSTNSKIGIGTTNPELRLTLDKGASAPDGGILAIGTYNPNNAALTDLATAGAGTRLIWYPKKAVFRAGYVSGTKWDEPTNIGNYSVAMGQDPRADADHSIALGYGTNTTGANSFATGKSATASGADSIAMGNATVASGTRSVAMGDTTTASGMNSTATGNNTTAIGNFSTAMDNYTTARAYASLVIGQYNIVTGTETTNNWIDTDPLFIIGNGNGIVGDPNQYANALTVLKNGNVGIGTTNPGTNRLEVTGGNIKSGGGLIMETTTNTTVTTPVAGLVWLCTDIGNGTPCDGI